MPKPNPGESLSAYAKRCIPEVIHEKKAAGKSGKEASREAAGKCYGMHKAAKT